MAVSKDKISELYQFIPQGAFKDEDEFRGYVTDENKLKEFYSFIPQGSFTDEDEYVGYFGEDLKKKVSPIESAAKGETVFQELGLPSEEPITPKLPYQSPPKVKTSQEETLATELTVTSVLKAQQKLPEYLQGEQEKLIEESTQAIKDELLKLKDNYQKKIEANPEKEKEFNKEFQEEQTKIIELRSANIPIAVESLYKKGKDYKWLDPTDVKELSKIASEIASKPIDFIQKKDALEGLKMDFMSKVGTLSPEEQDAVSKELSDVIAQSSVINEKGVPSVFGWKSEVSNKFVDTKGRLAELSQMEETPETKAEYNILYRAKQYYDRILKLPDDDGSFFEGFKSEGRNMLTAGMADLFDAANIGKISKKQQKGETLSDAEQTLYDAYGIFQTASSSEEFGKAYTRGKGIAGSLAFMESFALTGGLAGVGEKTALKMLGNQVKNKVVQNIAKGVGSAVARAPVLPMGMTETAKRLAGSPQMTETGEFKVDPATVEPVIKAIGKGLYSNFANALGETAGGWLAGTGVSKFVSTSLGINKIPKHVAKIFDRIGMQPLGELPEEYLTTLMETPVMGDQTLKEAFSAENVWETAVQVGLMSGFFSGIALPSVVNENLQRKRNKEMIDLFGKDKVAEIRNAIESGDKDAFNEALKGFEGIKDKKDKKKQLVRYANSLAQQKGARVAQEAAAMAKEETETTDQGTAVTKAGALEVPQEVADQKAQEEGITEKTQPQETKTEDRLIKGEEDSYSFKSDKTEIIVTQKAFSETWDVDVSTKDSSTSSGYRMRKDMSKSFETQEEALAYANKIANKISPEGKPQEATQETEVTEGEAVSSEMEQGETAQSTESIPLVEEKTDSSTGDVTPKPSLQESQPTVTDEKVKEGQTEDLISPIYKKEDYDLSKDREDDALFDIQKGLGFKLSRNYRTIGNTVIRVKNHTPEWGYFSEDIEDGATKVINVTVGDFDNADFRKSKTTLEQIKKEYPNVEFVDILIKPGDGINEALKKISEEINKPPVQKTEEFTGREQKEEIEQKEAKQAPTAPITKDQGKVPPPPQKPVKTQEKGAEGKKRTGFEKRETEKGTKGSIEKRNDEIGQIVKRIIDENPHFYKETTRADEIEKAQEFISSFASFGNALKNLLGKTKNYDDLIMRHVARQVMMQKLGEDLRDAMKSGDKQLQDAIANDIVNLEDITQKELRVAATTLSMTMWSFLTPEATVFMVNRVVNEANRSRLGFEAQQAEEFINKWNEEIPESVKRLLSENPELRDFLSKVKAVADKASQTKRTTKAKAKDIATKVRSLKSTNWGLTFADPIGATAILDGALEVTARTIETTGNILQAINDGVSEIRKSKWYQSLTRVKQKEVELKYNEKVREEVDFDATEYIEGQSWYAKATEGAPTELDKELTKEKKEAQRLKREADQRLKDLIFDTIASHWLVEKTDGKSLTDRLVDDVGLTRKEAEQIAKISEEAVRRDSQKIFDETLGEKIPNKNTKTSAFDKFFKLIKRGALTNENYYEVFAKDYRLQKGLTQEQKNELQRLSMNAHLMAPYGYLGDLAFNEFAQYMAKITEQDSWIERQTRLMIAANYARMLSGITTSKVNLTSAGINLIIRPFFGVANPVKWTKTAILLAQGKSKEAHLQNPLAALAYAMQAYRIGAEMGKTTAINIVRNGNIKEASKYLESVNNIGGQNIPELEKNTFGVGKRFKPWDALKFKVFGKTFLGDLNPWNAMKYSGRVLLAEDAAMFNIPFALELAMAARKEAILSGQFKSMKDLREKILNTIAGNNLTEEQAKNIEAQLEEQVQMLRAVGIEPTPMQIKQRRFELNRSLFDISQEQIDESTQLARGEIFTDKERGGMFSIIGDAIGSLSNKSLWWKIGIMPKIPFTGVLGRIADMSVDTALGYGALRAEGWSPTGIIARARYWAKTGQFKDFWKSPAKVGLFRSAQMGVRGSALYQRQMARHNFGMYLLGILGAIFLRGDGDDDEERKDKEGNPYIDITGGLLYHTWSEREKHYMGAYTAKIGRFKFRYLNYPILNTPFAIIGNYKDAQRAGKVTDDFIARMSLLARSWFYSLGLVKDTWLAKGINDIVEMIGGLFSMMGGEERRKILKDEELVEIEPRVQRQLENLRDDYTGLPINYLSPLKSNLLQQAIKFTTPESRLKGTGVQLWAYNVGLQWWNDKRTDIFGQEVKTLPGDQGTAWPRDTDERWANYWKYNVHVQDIIPREKLVIKGVPQTLEWEQYIERKGMVQNLFKDRWDEYFANNSEDVLEKRAETYKVEPRSGNKTNMVDLDIRDIWSNTKQDVHKYMFVWDDHVKGNEKLFDFLLEESLLPDFYSPEIKNEEGERIIIPFDKLLKTNDEIMEAFVPSATEFINSLSKEELKIWRETIVDTKTKETELERQVKWYWNIAKDDADFNLRSEINVW